MRHPTASMLSSVAGKIQDILVIFPLIATPDSAKEYEEVVSLFQTEGTVFRFLLIQNDFQLNLPSNNFRDGRLAFGSTDRGVRPKEVMRDIIDLTPVMDFPTLLKNWRDELTKIQTSKALMYQRWAQDPFVVKTLGDACVLLQPIYSQRMSYHFLPMELAAQQATNCLVQPCQLYLEGGNVLRGMRHAIIGKDLYHANVAYREAVIEKETHGGYRATAPIPQAFETAEFCTALGVPEVLLLGADTSHPKYAAPSGDVTVSYQPLFHIDLYVTLGGWYQDALAYGTAQAPIQAAVENAADLPAELAFVASSRLARTLLTGAGLAAACRLVDAAWDARFDEAKAQLRAAAYHVEDLPILMAKEFCFSWNNCLIEIDGPYRRVVLASYQVDTARDQNGEQLNAAFAILEPEVERIYRDNGFDVHWLRTERGDFFRRIVRQGGGLHCVTKVLRRTTTYATTPA
jgi:hypothetical protein